LAIAAGERFFCSRMGVKDWAKAREQVSANASGRCLKCMGARVANSRGFREIEGVAAIGLLVRFRAGEIGRAFSPWFFFGQATWGFASS